MTPTRRSPAHPGSSRGGASAAQALLKEAVARHQAGQLAKAQSLYEQALALRPDDPDALHLLGVVASQTGHHTRAVELIDRALTIRPRDPAFHGNRGHALKALGRLDEALAAYDRALALKADFLAAHVSRARTLKELGRFAEALAAQDEVVRLAPTRADGWNSRGKTLQELGRFEEALASFDRAISLRPDSASACTNRGVVLHALRRYAEALASYDRSIELRPESAETWSNRGLTLMQLGRADAALASFDAALRLKHDHANAHSNKGLVLQQLDRLEDAVASYGQAVALQPDDGFLYGTWLHARMKLCDWADLDVAIHELLARIERGLPVTPPFAVLGLTDSAPVQKKAAEIAVAAKHPLRDDLPAMTRRVGAERVRIGYFSADFHDHATAYLMADLFEQHDRERFELVGFSFGPDRDDPMRRRVAAAFDRFIDVRERSDREIAQLSRSVGIDIAVDLKGFTHGHRLGIFAHRAAPIQVSYLGYPGTTGAPYMDYLVADATLIPTSRTVHYTEKIVWMPDSYQVNDRKRQIADREFTRAELGLPAEGFVFCCFNNSFKLVPETFAAWMRILHHVGGSVLWLIQDNPVAAQNLRNEAGARGIDPGRLVFAPKLPLADHLARHRAADLFLDSWPCNAHTTASDALWAGLPVLTLAGEALASRVAASLLNAIGLPELITTTPTEYERRVIDLATDPQRLAGIRNTLERNRSGCALFDTPRFTRHLEAAFMQMLERDRAGLPPEHIHVERQQGMAGSG